MFALVLVHASRHPLSFLRVVSGGGGKDTGLLCSRYIRVPGGVVARNATRDIVQKVGPDAGCCTCEAEVIIEQQCENVSVNATF